MSAPQTATRRRPVKTSQEKSQLPKVRNMRNEINSNCYRLSKTQPISSKRITQDKTESYSTKYYREHQDEADDIRTPLEKLKEVDAKLDGEIEDEEERFTLLMKQKTLRYMVYGEKSVEALYSHVTLGEFYNFQETTQSSIRHFKLAKQLLSSTEPDNDTKAAIAVGLAEAYLIDSLENQKSLNVAAKELKPALKAEITDPYLRFRRDMCIARIVYAKGNIDEAYEAYLAAAETLPQCNPPSDEATASLYLEIAECGRNCGCGKDVAEHYKKAYDIYKSLDMEDQANEIEPFTHEDYFKNQEEEEEKQEQTNENEQEQEKKPEEGNENKEEDQKKEDIKKEESFEQFEEPTEEKSEEKKEEPEKKKENLEKKEENQSNPNLHLGSREPTEENFEDADK
ncbi:hypothetical protein TVAG_166490 [Trichomonas vaginalis G3]|uniref:TPR Domain containing protein n=1 Tax=Trichomonas vaginalis (strain ATCC PRA-98 / G3) TaxID=412133 RepID=A2DE56_TRIV3|nr:TPR-like family [Trichomonas vaginalis G3]EAY21274.1 hypothetical protein TVAG_166490 [Trichomonas vaginalis G3]KAI5548848.1 TPR-like family [Trichomonas vaginalis G3]|eukprot:XP_001582260.1 hypothetical protein [Trichomonas vaginalis G3]